MNAGSRDGTKERVVACGNQEMRCVIKDVTKGSLHNEKGRPEP